MRITVAGEALIDLIADPASEDGRLRPVPGGSPLNVAVGLGRLGVATAFLGGISDDPFGTLLSDRLRDADVEVLLPTVERPTTLALVHVDTSGHASYRFYLDGTSATRLRVDDPEILDAIARTPGPLHVSLGAVTLRTPGVGATLGELLSSSASRPFVSLDPNVRPSVLHDVAAERAALDMAVEAADLVKVSDADIAALHPGADPLSVAGSWARSGPAMVVLTRGAQGATAVRSDGGMLTVATLPVDVVDTVGAGDAFMSGLLAALAEADLLEREALRGADAATLRDALDLAARVAALTCTRAGAEPPWRAELTALGA
jgi:fructokinase